MMQIGIALISAGVGFSLLNWWWVYLSWWTGRFHSCVPLIGTGLMAGGMLLLPGMPLYGWLALFLDIGTLGLVAASPAIMKEIWQTSRFNLLEEYGYRHRDREVQLHLYRRGVFVLIQRFPAMSVSTTGSWNREDSQLSLTMGENSATFVVVNDSVGEKIVQAIGFACYEKSGLNLNGVELKLKYRRTQPDLGRKNH